MYQTPYSYVNPYPTMTQIIKVHGRNGADTYRMMPNSSVLLLDETEPIVYLAQTDGAGYKTITAYDIQLHQELPPVDTRSLEQRISKIEEMLNNEPNHTNFRTVQDRASKTDGSNVQGNKQPQYTCQSDAK